MAGIVKQTALLSAARIANYGLMLISPIILVRLLTVEQFGQYRQFVLYASLLQLIAAFSFAESLLYLIPSYPRSPWRVIGQTSLFVAASSAAVVLLLLLAMAFGLGNVFGPEPWALAAYVILFVNIDFWEFYFLATNRPVAVFLYTAGRLAARMGVVISAAYFAHDVAVIIWSLVGLETLRLAAAAASWRALALPAREPPVPGLWREQLRFCLPAGTAALVYLVNRNLGSIVISRLLGPAALAMFTIGTYGEFVYLAIGNSIAAVLLPELVRLNGIAREEGLKLWKKVTIVRCMLLLPTAVFLARYAYEIVTTAFGQHYLPAAAVMQVYTLFLVRGCLDFSPVVRSINRTRVLVYGSMAAMLANILLLMLLMPRMGIRGAIAALVLSSFAEAVTFGWWATRLYGMSIIQMVPWEGIGKVVLAVAGAALLTLHGAWTDHFGPLGVVLAGATFAAALIAALLLLRVPEARELLQKASRWLGWARRGAFAGHE
jgi:O-antigen/teichoic acid export membrane protein